MLSSELHQPSVPVRVRGCLEVSQDATERGHRRGGEGVAVGIHSDDDVD